MLDRLKGDGMLDQIVHEDLRVRKPPPLSEMAYEKIKRMIVSLQLEPGSPVVLEHLVNQLGVSRTPIRDAIVRLQGDGFVETDPDEGTYVTPITPERVIELYQVRRPMECLAVRLAGPQLDEPTLTSLQAMFAQVGNDMQAGEYDRYFSSDTTFHQAILEAAGNRWLRRILQPITEHVYRVRLYAKSRRGSHMSASHHEHIEVLAALKERNFDRAERLMGEHIVGTASRLAQLW